jgi:hypothetical protein
MEPTGISRVSRDVAEEMAVSPPGGGTKVFALRRGIRDKKSLFAAVREGLPLDPPLTLGSEKWDALEDSLWSGLHAVEEPNVVVVWPEADEMLQASSNDFEIAVSILADIAQTLGDAKVTNGPVKSVTFILGGTWSESQP